MIFLYPSVDDVVELFAAHVGQRDALTRPDLLDSAVAAPQQTMFGEDLYPHIYLKAAALLRSIAQNQAFADGNKRIAWLTMRVFLAANGLDVIATVAEGLELMIALAENRVDVNAIADFLAERSRIRLDADDFAS